MITTGVTPAGFLWSARAVLPNGNTRLPADIMESCTVITTRLSKEVILGRASPLMRTIEENTEHQTGGCPYLSTYCTCLLCSSLHSLDWKRKRTERNMEERTLGGSERLAHHQARDAPSGMLTQTQVNVWPKVIQSGLWLRICTQVLTPASAPYRSYP